MIQVLRPVGASQAVAIGAASTAASALSSVAEYVRLAPDADCYVSFGGTASAATGMKVLGSTVEYFVATPGLVISAIQASTGVTGTLNLTEMTR